MSRSDTHSFPLPAAAGGLAALQLYFMCLNCVASLQNSGNEFTLSVTSIVFTRFQEQLARRRAARWLQSFVDPKRTCNGAFSPTVRCSALDHHIPHTYQQRKGAYSSCVLENSSGISKPHFHLDRALVKTSGPMGLSPSAPLKLKSLSLDDSG